MSDQTPEAPVTDVPLDAPTVDPTVAPELPEAPAPEVVPVTEPAVAEATVVPDGTVEPDAVAPPTLADDAAAAAEAAAAAPAPEAPVEVPAPVVVEAPEGVQEAVASAITDVTTPILADSTPVVNQVSPTEADPFPAGNVVVVNDNPQVTQVPVEAWTAQQTNTFFALEHEVAGIDYTITVEETVTVSPGQLTVSS